VIGVAPRPRTGLGHGRLPLVRAAGAYSFAGSYGLATIGEVSTMSRPISSRRAVVVGVIAAATAVVAAASPSSSHPAASAVVDGLTFSYHMTSARAERDKSSEAARARNMNTLVRMSAGAVRMDFREGGTSLSGKNGYMILRDQPSQIEFVNPDDKKVTILGADALGAGLGALTNNALVKITTSNEHFDWQDLGAGPSILGYKTRHVRLTSGQTTEMRVLFKRSKSTSETIMDAYVTPDVKVDEGAMKVWSRNFAGGLRTTNAELLGKMDSYREGPGRGIMLKATNYVKETDEKNKTTYDTLMVEVTELKRGSLDASLFTYPKDYEVMDMTAAVAAAADSAKNASAAGDKKTANGSGNLVDTTVNAAKDGVKEGLKEGAKEEAKDKVKKGIRGIFKKP
jgi:uncharacterized protein DUF4412